jgi:acyl-CoA thioesterase
MKGIVYGHSASVLIGKVTLVSFSDNWVACGVHGERSDEGRGATTSAIWRRTGD